LAQMMQEELGGDEAYAKGSVLEMGAMTHKVSLSVARFGSLSAAS
jgi:hypothetical protein